MSSASQSTSVVSITPPDGASCWLCLEEGPDDSGAPLVRDCSCRGHSGFAHLPCRVKYAESKIKDLAKRGAHIMSNMFDGKIFEHCPNCKQEYQNDLYYDMTKAQLAFIEREFIEVDRWYLRALKRRILILDGEKEADRIEGEEISAKMLTRIDKMKNSSDPPLHVLAGVYLDIGRFNFSVGTNRCLEKAKYYLEKARDIFKTSGDRELQLMVKSIEGNIAAVEERLSGGSLPKKTESDLSDFRVRYNCLLQAFGTHDVRSIRMGSHLASGLSLANHTIEASRLLDRLVIISRRVHGSDHKETKNAELWWQRLQLRCVVWIRTDEMYQALRYENDGKSCVMVPSNLDASRNVDDEETFSVPISEILFSLGTPVMLHGLKKAAHLNGEIGDVREYCKLSDRWVVHLEDKNLKPVKVKHENLRIVFDLPDPKNLD
ncbi:hypothetical protein QTG54_009023 [Skeletonema marinoi]|uniref:RING-CH-type domain-containing protein n=1 Tax=Skeletonema marinoi TaxID=267567 RepID=A0AAD8Y6G6_9STRA|nr:hypothetical protein QTG54_009023 [Skeletonema marinoi]